MLFESYGENINKNFLILRTMSFQVLPLNKWILIEVKYLSFEQNFEKSENVWLILLKSKKPSLLMSGLRHWSVPQGPFITRIENRLKRRDQFRRLDSYVGGRPGFPVLTFQRPECKNLIWFVNIILHDGLCINYSAQPELVKKGPWGTHQCLNPKYKERRLLTFE